MDTEQTHKTPFWKNKKILYGILILFVASSIVDVLDGTSAPTSAPVETVDQKQPQDQGNAVADTKEEASNTQSKEDAQKELDEVMKLAQTSGLVTSYEFSEKANVVYVGKIWYTQTVAFKKDFMGKVAGLKKTITGYHRFEVLDTYSNEKVAEVTAFSGSLEVYK